MCISDLAFAATLHVPADYPTIQSCIDAAISGQDECVVAPGTYHELINFLGKAITLRSSHGPEVTTIDGTGLGGSVVTCINSEGQNTQLQGFAITGGIGTLVDDFVTYGPAYSKFLGGGMRIGITTDPVIENCVFAANEADVGGGIYIGYFSFPVVRNCAFIGNHARWLGGGIYNDRGYSAILHTNFTENSSDEGGGLFSYEGYLFVQNCKFLRNEARVIGGGMLDFMAYGRIDNCTFDSNSADFGGGLWKDAAFDDEQQVRCSLFIGNRAAVGAGAGGTGDWDEVAFEDCRFENNQASEQGGGLIWWSGGVVVSKCQFLRNRAPLGGGASIDSISGGFFESCTFHGNVADFGGAMGTYFQSWVGFQSCILSGNSAQTGGAVYAAQELSLDNTTIHGNIAEVDGSGVVAYRAELRNSIVWGNGTGSAQDQLVLQGELEPHFISYCDIQSSGGSTNWNTEMGPDGGGNIDLDPMFARTPNPGPDGIWDDIDDDYGDLRLQPGSPCINAGDPNFVLQPVETDLDGHARVLCGRVDMGAYEFGIGDFDCNQSVDLVDVAAWEGCASDPSDLPSPRPAPFEGEGEVIGGRTFRGLALPATHHRPFGARFAGPNATTGSASLHPWQHALAPAAATACEAFDFDADGDIDLRDLAQFMVIITP